MVLLQNGVVGTGGVALHERCGFTAQAGERRCWRFAILFGCSIVALPISGTYAMGRLLHSTEDQFSRCRVDRVEAKFTTPSVPSYYVWGTCYVFDSSNTVKDRHNPHPESKFDNETLLYTIRWEARGKYIADKKTAEETISVLKQVRPDQPNYQAVGKINATMSCEQDPWLAAPKGGCQLNYSGSDQSLRVWSLTDIYPHSSSVPASSNVPSEQRTALNEQYQRALAYRKKLNAGGETTQLQKSGTEKSRTPVSQASKTPAALATAPIIRSPSGTVFKGSGALKITPSPYHSGTHVLIQLKWLNPPASAQGEGLNFYQYEVPIGEIGSARGMPAPDSYLAPGLWEMRVRISQPKVSDWSQPVRFTYLDNPAVKSAAGVRNQTQTQSKSVAPNTANSAPKTQAVGAPQTGTTTAPPSTGAAPTKTGGATSPATTLGKDRSSALPAAAGK